MSENLTPKQKLQAEATALGIPFEESTTTKDLEKLIAAKKAEDAKNTGDGDNTGNTADTGSAGGDGSKGDTKKVAVEETVYFSNPHGGKPDKRTFSKEVHGDAWETECKSFKKKFENRLLTEEKYNAAVA